MPKFEFQTFRKEKKKVSNFLINNELSKVSQNFQKGSRNCWLEEISKKNMKIGVSNYHYFKLLRLVYNSRKNENLIEYFLMVTHHKYLNFLELSKFDNKVYERSLVYNNIINTKFAYLVK